MKLKWISRLLSTLLPSYLFLSFWTKCFCVNFGRFVKLKNSTFLNYEFGNGCFLPCKIILFCGKRQSSSEIPLFHKGAPYELRRRPLQTIKNYRSPSFTLNIGHIGLTWFFSIFRLTGEIEKGDKKIKRSLVARFRRSWKSVKLECVSYLQLSYIGNSLIKAGPSIFPHPYSRDHFEGKPPFLSNPSRDG